MIKYLTQKNSNFEHIYQKAQTIEHRNFTDEQALQLPFLKKHPLEKEWKKRRHTLVNFKGYFENNKPNVIVEIGCGNGWFCHWLSQQCKTATIVGIDVNDDKLQQADKLFSSTNVSFAYADIFKLNMLPQKADLIVLNAAIQYFNDVKKLLTVLLNFLTENGEIHILDSAFYRCDLIDDARERSEVYFHKIGVPEMQNHYFHHCWDDLKGFTYRINYVPPVYCRWVTKLGLFAYSPFPWISVHKKPPES